MSEIQRYSPSEYGMELMFTIPVDLKVISKSNSKAKYLPEVYRTFEEGIAWLGAVRCKRPRFKGGWVVLRLHYKDRKHVDPTNSFKSLVDGLVKGLVFEDDDQVYGTVVPIVYGDLHSTVEIWSLPITKEHK